MIPACIVMQHDQVVWMHRTAAVMIQHIRQINGCFQSFIYLTASFWREGSAQAQAAGRSHAAPCKEDVCSCGTGIQAALEEHSNICQEKLIILKIMRLQMLWFLLFKLICMHVIATSTETTSLCLMHVMRNIHGVQREEQKKWMCVNHYCSQRQGEISVTWTWNSILEVEIVVWSGNESCHWEAPQPIQAGSAGKFKTDRQAPWVFFVLFISLITLKSWSVWVGVLAFLLITNPVGVNVFLVLVISLLTLKPWLVWVDVLAFLLITSPLTDHKSCWCQCFFVLFISLITLKPWSVWVGVFAFVLITNLVG